MEEGFKMKKKKQNTIFIFFFSSRRRHTRYWRDWSSDVCSSDLKTITDKSSTSPLDHVATKSREIERVNMNLQLSV